MTQKLSISAQLSAVENAKHALHSPASNIMRGSERKLLIEHLEGVMNTLRFCQTNYPAIREFMAAKKADRS